MSNNSAPHDSAPSWRGMLARTAGFLAFWVILAGIEPVDLLVGAVSAVIATAVSVRLLPPGQMRVAPVASMRFVLRFLQQSVVAGVDVAWRALDPRLPLRPGFVAYEPRLPAGPARDAFCTVTSLLPGTLPSGPGRDDAILVHCLDVDAPLSEQLAEEERRFTQAFGGRAA
ncbi:MAG: Na+/H+ antiporter subunit E [Gammaproteobacteria bacterium]|nr:Na+/H+ antiporter subunit E [Gammaproteobacteria bacterium]